MDKSKYLDLVIPLALSLKKNMDDLIHFNDTVLWSCLQSSPELKKKLGPLGDVFKSFKLEYKKIWEGGSCRSILTTTATNSRNAR